MMLIVGILLLLYSSVCTVYSSTLRAMGGVALKTIARIFGIIFTLCGLCSMLM